MKSYYILLIALFCACPSWAQKRFSIQVGSGAGSYKQKDLREIQDRLDNQWRSAGIKTIDDFPMYLHYTGEVTFAITPKFITGFIYRFESTGYKSAYSDYSGLIRLEQSLRVNEAGILLHYELVKFKRITLAFQERTYYSFTKSEFNSHFEVYGSSAPDENYKLKSKSVLINPGLDLSCQLIEQINLHFGAGYCVDLKGDLKDDRDNNLNIQSDWSGVRINAAIGFLF